MTRFGRLDFFIEMKTFRASIVEKYHGNSEAKSKHFHLGTMMQQKHRLHPEMANMVRLVGSNLQLGQKQRPRLPGGTKG